MATGITQSEYAREIGCSRQYVSKLVKMGKIRFRNGLIYLDSVGAKNTDGAEQKVPIPRSGKTDSVTGDGEKKGYWNTKTEVEQFNALLKELQYHKLIGTLVLASEVEKVAFNTSRKVRDRLNSLPERLFQVLAAEMRPEEIKKILKREIGEVEDELANSFGGEDIPPGICERNPSGPGRNGKPVV